MKADDKWAGGEIVPISPTVTMCYTYILKSKSTLGYYVGSCNNVKNRLVMHNNGYVQSTRAARPWKLYYVEEYPDLRDARKRELQIKRWKSRAAIERLTNR